MPPPIAPMRGHGDAPRCNWLVPSDAGWMEKGREEGGGREGGRDRQRPPTHRKPKADVIHFVWMTSLYFQRSCTHTHTHTHTHTNRQTSFHSVSISSYTNTHTHTHTLSYEHTVFCLASIQTLLYFHSHDDRWLAAGSFCDLYQAVLTPQESERKQNNECRRLQKCYSSVLRDVIKHKV